MASKNLKAVAIRGTKGVGNVRDIKAFFKATQAAKAVLAGNPVTGEGLPKLGTQVLMNVINEVGAMPTRNMREVQFEGANRIGAEAMLVPRESDGKANLTTKAASPPSTPSTTPSSTSRNTWAPMAAWSTKRPGRWVQTRVWTISTR
jgi:aldehyde:ferredoxin oxidoreductase